MMMMPDSMLFAGRAQMMAFDSQVDFQGMKSVRDGQAEKFNEVFTETKRMKARSNKPVQEEQTGREAMPGMHSPLSPMSKETNEHINEAKVKMEYTLMKMSQKAGMDSMEGDLISLMSCLNLQDGEALLTELSKMGDNQQLKLDPSLFAGMAGIGLASKNEGMALSGLGGKSALPALAHEVIEQIAQKLSVQRLNLNGKEGVTLELSPKELGALKIEIVVHKGSVTADIFTQYPIVKEILEKILSLLHDGLMQSGFNIDQFSVNVGDFGNQSDTQSDQERFHFSNGADDSPLRVGEGARGLARIENGMSLYI
jgi:hypothetical protein